MLLFSSVITLPACGASIPARISYWESLTPLPTFSKNFSSSRPFRFSSARSYLQGHKQCPADKTCQAGLGQLLLLLLLLLQFTG